MTYFNINALSLPCNLLKRKLMYKNLIGTNAGIVWRAMANDRSWTYEELKEETELSDKELLMAIGWLARENQVEFDISAEVERIYLNRSYF